MLNHRLLVSLLTQSSPFLAPHLLTSVLTSVKNSMVLANVDAKRYDLKFVSYLLS